MSDLIFECPACGQRIECKQRQTAENIPCPSCAALIRIPGTGSADDAPPEPPKPKAAPVSDNAFPPLDDAASVAAKKDEVLSYTAVGEDAASPHPGSSVKNTAPVAGHTSNADPAPAPPPPETPAPELEPPGFAELTCRCPVCQSNLQVRIQAEVGSGNRSRPSSEPHGPDKAPEQAPASHPAPASAEEREQQIAAARQDKHIQAYPSMKPRLSLILSGEQSPGKGESGSQAGAPGKPAPANPPDSFAE